MSKHYTATIDVKVSDRVATETDYRGEAKGWEREVTDVARVVVRAETLDGLRTKLQGHIALIEEG